MIIREREGLAFMRTTDNVMKAAHDASRHGGATGLPSEPARVSIAWTLSWRMLEPSQRRFIEKRGWI
jgi:hypothetical protein